MVNNLFVWLYYCTGIVYNYINLSIHGSQGRAVMAYPQDILYDFTY